MRFFFDNCLSPKYVEILLSLGEDVVHLRDHFAPDAADEVWISAVARRGWCAVSSDIRITRTPQIADVLRAVRLVAFFLPAKVQHKPLFEQGAWLLSHWEGIRDCAVGRRKNDPYVHMIQENGKVLTYEQYRSKRKRRR